MITLSTSDNKRFVDVGGTDIWKSIYSTAEARLGLYKNKVPLALDFLRTGNCEAKNSLETARQINLIHDKLAQYDPEKAVYDIDNPHQPAPWSGKISPVITSCANLYTTSDGKDLFTEVFELLEYASKENVSVFAG